MISWHNSFWKNLIKKCFSSKSLVSLSSEFVFFFKNHIIFDTSILPCSSNKWLVLWSIDSSRVVTAWSEFPCVVRGRMQYFFLLSKTELASLNLLLFVIVATSGQVINVDNLTKIHRMKHACTLAQNLFHYSNNHEGMLMITCLLLERRRKKISKKFRFTLQWLPASQQWI